MLVSQHSTKKIERKSLSEHDWYFIGCVITWLILFIGFWIYCIAAYGFFFGVALGWLPSGIAATVASFLWPLIALAVDFLVWGIFFW